MPNCTPHPSNRRATNPRYLPAPVGVPGAVHCPGLPAAPVGVTGEAAYGPGDRNGLAAAGLAVRTGGAASTASSADRADTSKSEHFCQRERNYGIKAGLARSDLDAGGETTFYMYMFRVHR